MGSIQQQLGYTSLKHDKLIIKVDTAKECFCIRERKFQNRIKERIKIPFFKTVSAFANYDGKIVFGVSENGSIEGIVDLKNTSSA